MRLMRRLQARAVAMTLLVLLFGWCVVGLVVPQRSVAGEAGYHAWANSHPTLAVTMQALDLDHVYSSTAFLGTILVLVVVLAGGTWRMARSLRSASLAAPNPLPRSEAHTFEYATPHPSLLAAATKLAVARGYVVLSSGPTVVLRRNMIGRWGTLLLHGGLTIVVIGSLVAFLFEQRAYVPVLEHDTLFGAQAEFLGSDQGPFAGPFAPNVTVTLDSCIPAFYGSGAVASLESRVRLGNDPGSLTSGMIGVNNPATLGDVKIYQSMSFGYTVGLHVTSDLGDSPIYLSLDQPQHIGSPATGVSELPLTPLSASLTLEPDPQGKSFAIAQPVLSMVLHEGEREVYRGRLVEGEVVTIGTTSLRFVDVRRWSGFILTSTPWVPSVFAGFVLAIVGLILIYGFPERCLVLAVREHAGERIVRITGYARRDKCLFKEEFRFFVEEVICIEGMVNIDAELADA